MYLTANKGNVTTVDEFLAFKRVPDGKLRIILHKSAPPFNLP